MPSPEPCCQNPATLANAHAPFSRILALDYYDGPTGGVLQCDACGADYRFDMLDWSEEHDVRIFRLARLPPGALAECVRVLAPYGPPRWPVWVPSRTNRPAENTGDVAYGAVNAILAQARPAEEVIAWLQSADTVLAARQVPVDELQGVPDWFSLDGTAPTRDWFSFLGLSRARRLLDRRSAS